MGSARSSAFGRDPNDAPPPSAHAGSSGPLGDAPARNQQVGRSLEGAAEGLPTGEGLVAVQAAALASVSDAVMITDRSGGIVWVNAAFTTMSGYSAEEAVGANPRLLKSGVQDESHYRRLWETILAGRRWRSEVVERHKDGHHYRVVQTVTPIVDAAGGVRYFVAVHENITELRSSQAQLQALFDHALDGLLLYDDEARVVAANPAISTLTGYTPEQMTRMTIADVVAEQAIDEYKASQEQLRDTGSMRGTLPLIRRDGQQVEVEFQSVADVAPGVHLSVIRDVTEQRRWQAAERFQSQLLEAVAEAVIATDLEGVVVYWNPAAEHLYGWPASEALGRNLAELTISDPTDAQPAEIIQRVLAGERSTGGYEARRRDGSIVPVWATDAAFYDAGGRPAGIIAVSSDISELEVARARLAVRVRQLAVVAELGRYALDSDNPRAVGVEAERRVNELLGSTIRARMRWSPRPDPSPGHDDPGLLQIPVTATASLLVVSTDGRERLDVDDEEFLRSVANVISASVRHHDATSDLAHLATHDSLTGLPNRALFTDRLGLARAAATRTGRGYAVLFLDFDGFKTINDSLGHDAGDEILRIAANRLQATLRAADTVARFGGDEFAILCPELDAELTANELGRRVRKALATPFETTYGPLTMTASIGIASGDGTSEPSELIRDADMAMYAAKDSGRDRIECFDASLHKLADQRLSTVRQVRDALAGDGIVVRYQPTIELSTGELVGVEALARLRRPDGSLLPPAAFIDIAEETGLIGALGKRVLEITCADAAEWRVTDPAFEVAVNVSPRQFADPHLADTIARTLDATGLPATNLWLEITESALLTSPQVHTAIRTLRLLGVNFAIDDFGTGYSSLAHLRNTPVDALKIDRSFVAGLLDNPRDRALIVASLDLARAFNLLSVAEGVETDQQRAELTRLGCQNAQGYLWSRPVAAQHITSMITGTPWQRHRQDARSAASREAGNHDASRRARGPH